MYRSRTALSPTQRRSGSRNVIVVDTAGVMTAVTIDVTTAASERYRAWCVMGDVSIERHIW